MPPQLSLPSILLDLIGIFDPLNPIPIILALLGKKLLALGI